MLSAANPSARTSRVAAASDGISDPLPYLTRIVSPLASAQSNFGVVPPRRVTRKRQRDLVDGRGAKLARPRPGGLIRARPGRGSAHRAAPRSETTRSSAERGWARAISAGVGAVTVVSERWVVPTASQTPVAIKVTPTTAATPPRTRWRSAIDRPASSARGRGPSQAIKPGSGRAAAEFGKTRSSWAAVRSKAPATALLSSARVSSVGLRSRPS